MTQFSLNELGSVVRLSLRAIGYSDELIRDDYPFRSSFGRRGVVPTIRLAAFAQNPPSERNACIGIALPPDHLPTSVRPFRDLGAPQIIAIHPDDGLGRRWKMTADLPQIIEEFELDSLSAKFEENRDQWAPARIFQAKRALPAGLTDLAEQLDFMDLGLMPALEADLRGKLDREIQGILNKCRTKFEEFHVGVRFDTVQEPAFRLIFRLIAAKMLIDRGERSEWRQLPVSEVLANVEDFYFRHESAEPPLNEPNVQAAVWQHIRNGLDLQNLSVETLAYVYENTFVTKAARSDLGIHATPPEVAEYIVRQLPIEDLPEQERIVFEPFTGPAPFLVAAMSRLRELSTAPDGARHDYFQRMLMGVEADAFAHEIARYSLILADYPNPDGWAITNADAYTTPEFDSLLQRASIVLCNPPFGDFPLGNRPAGAELFQRDAEALRRVLQHPPALLGFVLPQTFLTRTEDRALRQQIRQVYSNISIVVLPNRIFKKADVETVLLIAHSLGETPRHRSAQVDTADRKQFLQTGELTWQAETDFAATAASNDILWQRPEWQPLWQSLAAAPQFESLLAKWGRGLQFNKGLRPECIADEPRSGFGVGINRVEEPYLVPNIQYLCRDEEKLRDNPDLPWAQGKVIVNTFRSSRGFWRIKGAIDEDGLVFSEYCIGLWPRSEIPVELLAAIINGPIASAFLFDKLANQDNQIRTIKQIPVPQFTPDQVETIVGLVRDYQSWRDQWITEPDRAAFLSRKCLELIWQIDAEVLAAYNLPPEVQANLLARFTYATRRSIPVPFPGYGEGYEEAERALDREKEYQNVLVQYQTFVDKKYLVGLTIEESEEMERLGRLLDKADAPFYATILSDMQTSGNEK